MGSQKKRIAANLNVFTIRGATLIIRSLKQGIAQLEILKQG